MILNYENHLETVKRIHALSFRDAEKQHRSAELITDFCLQGRSGGMGSCWTIYPIQRTAEVRDEEYKTGFSYHVPITCKHHLPLFQRVRAV